MSRLALLDVLTFYLMAYNNAVTYTQNELVVQNQLMLGYGDSQMLT